MRTFTVYSLRKFKLYNTVLSAIVILLYVRLSNLIHLIAECLYPFTISPYFPHPLNNLISNVIVIYLTLIHQNIF